MGLTDSENNGIPATMLVGPTSVGNGAYPYPVYQGGNNNGFGGDNGWWIVLLIILLAAGGWNNGNNNGGGAWGGGQPIIVNDGNGGSVQRGFDQAAVMSGIAGVQSGVQNLATQLCGCCGDIQNSLCNGFNGVTSAVNGAQNAISQQLYTNQIADLNRSFDAQTAVTQGMNTLAMNQQNCCCENRASIADLKYTVATENCADRQALNEGVRDIIANQTAGTQRILDQLCADKIEQKNDIIAQLRSELMYARGQASQDVQTAAIQAGQRALANEVEQYVAPRAIPSYTVQNPNCCTNYNACGCGCGM